MATSSDYANLYVANKGNNTLVHFAIAGDGSLTQHDMVTLSFAPVAIAVNLANSYIYVTGGAGPGKLAVYPLSSGAIGTLSSLTSLTVPGNAGDNLIPTAIATLSDNDAVYVAAYDQSAYDPGGTVTSSANPGWVYGFAVGSNGALTPANGSPYLAGVKPSGVATDPTNRFVYVTDFASNELIGYTVQSGSSLSFMINGPFKVGSEPSAVAVDPRGLYIYVANSLQSSVTAFSIVLSTGSPSAIASVTGSSSGYGTDTDPVAILIDPALGRWLYTSNYLGNSITGLHMNTNSGALSQDQVTPFPTGAYPAAMASVPHGNHNIESVTP